MNRRHRRASAALAAVRVRDPLNVVYPTTAYRSVRAKVRWLGRSHDRRHRDYELETAEPQPPDYYDEPDAEEQHQRWVDRGCPGMP